LTVNGSTISSEAVWSEDSVRGAKGGGVGEFFPVPAYQAAIGVPDVAGDAESLTGYFVRVDGQEFTVGGTSDVAPLWVGLIALMNQKLGHNVEFLNPLLYGSLVGSGAFLDNVSGHKRGICCETQLGPVHRLGNGQWNETLPRLWWLNASLPKAAVQRLCCARCNAVSSPEWDQ
jgi:hypothetical protein